MNDTTKSAPRGDDTHQQLVRANLAPDGFHAVLPPNATAPCDGCFFIQSKASCRDRPCCALERDDGLDVIFRPNTPGLLRQADKGKTT